jgi:serine/threonine protein kinase/tetratricopeptide (TPR) repeat protein
MAPKDIDQIFWDAAQIADPAERNAYLDRACADAHEMRRRVEQLLDAQSRAEKFLNSPAPPAVATVDEPAREQPGSIIGPYKLLEQIGEGGMGLVFVAEQQQPVRRKVAIKVVKPGMDSRQIIARFEAERQALALMDHQNIARVLDAGATSTGRPYFAMELVRGVPITDYCDQNRLAVRERLELFVAVCRAVQHAHTKGIIHRDLKPSNVLVESHDGRPVVKVIDFGIAKALGQQLTDKTLHTGFAQMIGTPLYMSPEQASLSGLDIDTRSDIYSLGVLLYELLTGTMPFDKKRLEGVSFDELRRIIREEEPPRPSSRLSTLAEAATLVAERRQSDQRRLSLLFRGELDWIVLKALEKDRTRRYETASAFAADVEHYLRDEPVLACPPSAWYRWSKFARRHRAALGTAALTLLVVVLLLVGAAATVLWSYQEDVRQSEAERAVRHALAQAGDTHQALQQQLREPGGVFRLLNNPAAWHGRIQAAQSALESARALAKNVGDRRQDLLSAEIEELEEQVQSDEKDYRLALDLEKVRLDAATLIEDKPDFAGTARAYGQIFRQVGLRGLNHEADAMVLAATIRRSPIREQVVSALDNWAVVAKILDQHEMTAQLLALARLSDADPGRNQLRDVKLWRDLTALAKVSAALKARPGRDGTATAHPSGRLSPHLYFLVGALLSEKGTEGEAWLREGLAAYPADFWLNSQFGIVLGQKKQFEEAVGFLRVAAVLRPQSSTTHLNLGLALAKKGTPEEAIKEFHRALELDRNNAKAHCYLGHTLYDKKDLDGAIKEFRLAIKLDVKYAAPHNSLGIALRDRGDLEEAIREFQRALDIDPGHAESHNNLGSALADKGQHEEAVRQFHLAIKFAPKLAKAHYNLGSMHYHKKNLPEAAKEFRLAIKLDPGYAPAHNNLGSTLRAMNKLKGAIEEYRRAIQLDPRYIMAHINLATALAAQRDLNGAIQEYRRAIQLDPSNGLAHLGLANILADQGKRLKAIQEYRRAIQLDPSNAMAHHNLGIVLEEQQDLEGAIKEFRLAAHLDHKLLEAHGSLAQALLAHGEFAEAQQAFRQCLQLLPPGHELRWATQVLLEQCQEALQQEQRVNALLQGPAPLNGSAEQLELAQFCRQYRRYPAAVRLYAAVLAAQPGLADDLAKGHRYQAACAAALAAAGKGHNADTLTVSDRATLRRQALAWLRADLQLFTRMIAAQQAANKKAKQLPPSPLEKLSGQAHEHTPADLLLVCDWLKHWQATPDLNSLRDDQQLAGLSPKEQIDWRQFWTEVRALEKQARSCLAK